MKGWFTLKTLSICPGCPTLAGLVGCTSPVPVCPIEEHCESIQRHWTGRTAAWAKRILQDLRLRCYEHFGNCFFSYTCICINRLIHFACNNIQNDVSSGLSCGIVLKKTLFLNTIEYTCWATDQYSINLYRQMTIEDDRPKQTPDDFLIVKTCPPMCFHRRKRPAAEPVSTNRWHRLFGIGLFLQQKFGAFVS